MSFNLFVYGTLKRDGKAAARMRDCQWLGPATVGGILYDVGEFTTLVLYGNTPVPGEVWRCPPEKLKELDEYEGVERGLFRRVGVHAQTANGEPLGCWIYVAGPRLSLKLTPDRQISPAVTLR